MSVLGLKVDAPVTYDPTILFKEKRDKNRVKYGIIDGRDIFCGVDIWDCFEFSTLLDNGIPICARLKIVIDAASECIVESKSLKLYLNSFNNSKVVKTNDYEEAIERSREIIERDLGMLLFSDEEIKEKCFGVSIYPCGAESSSLTPWADEPADCDIRESYKDLRTLVSSGVSASSYTEDPLCLVSKKDMKVPRLYKVKTDILRSNCKITHQPDFADLFIKIRTNTHLDFDSLMKYIVSFRNENHFHEEVVEMIYKRLWDMYSPDELMVIASYTRRGGISIMPIRASESEMVPAMLLTKDHKKTERQ